MTALSLAAAQVLADAALFRRVVAFQRGLAIPLFEFWRAHAPDDGAPLRLNPNSAMQLVDELAAYGTLELLAMAKRATYCTPWRGPVGGDPLMQLSLWHVAHSALDADRADILEWALATKSSKLADSPRDVWVVWEGVVRRFTDDTGPPILDVLKKHLALPTRELNALIDQESHRITHVSLLRWFTQEIPDVQLPPIMVEYAARRRDLPMIQVLHDHGVRSSDPYRFIRSNDIVSILDVLAFFLEHYAEGPDQSMLRNLAEHTDPEVQQLALRFAERLQPALGNCINQDSKDSRLAHVEDWAARGLISPRWPISIDKPAANGNLATVRFLHEQGIATATTDAMDHAAANGHLQMLEFLHAHRAEGCSFAAVRDALREGHFHVIRFLVAKFRDLFNVDAFDEVFVANAVRTTLPLGRLENVEFLFDHFPHLFTGELLPDLLLHGAFDIYRALQSQHPDGADAVLESTLFEAGQTMELRTIRFVVNDLGRRDLAYRAMDGAASTAACADHWVRAVHLVTGPDSCRLSAVRSAVDHLVAGVPFDSQSFQLNSLKYLIRTCCGPDAKKVAIEAAEAHRDSSPIDKGGHGDQGGNDQSSEPAIAAIVDGLSKWDPSIVDDGHDASKTLHPFLLDPRVKGWALRRLLDCSWGPCEHKAHWAHHSVMWHDLSLLEVISETPATPWHTHVAHAGSTDAATTACVLSFEGARRLALHDRSLAIFQWLVEHPGDVPVESTLLEEAVFHDQREVALWLVENHPEACAKVQNEQQPIYFNRMSRDQLEWLEANPAVRAALSFDCFVAA